MKNILVSALECTDGYKLGHKDQYPAGTEYVYANWTPRSGKNYPEATDGSVVFGVRLMLESLVDMFDNSFFDMPLHEVVDSYKRRVKNFLGVDDYNTDHVVALHELGYLPLKIKSLPEGDICPFGVPMITIVNTDPRFAWLVNYLETWFSNELWLPMTSATTARIFKKNLKEHAVKTGFYTDAVGFLCHDFSMRGMGLIGATIGSGLGHLTSFYGSESIPAIAAAEMYYDANVEEELVASTIPATEHSVMCAGQKESEIDTFKRLLTQIYPKGYLSVVSDTWDYWKVVTEYLPALKDIIEARDGRLVIRPDSGDPVDIICGVKCKSFDTLNDLENYLNKLSDFENNGININEFTSCCDDNDSFRVFIKSENKYKLVFRKLNLKADDIIIEDYPEIKGTYELLWDIFGGTINDKGYKVLSDKIGIIYGDAITLERQVEIYKRLEAKGFAATNLVLGVGSFTYQFKTRDSLGFAMKSTWCQVNGEGRVIFKDPKTDSGVKKSLKGLIYVSKDDNGKYFAVDNVNHDAEGTGYLKTVFLNGEILETPSLNDIRERINQTLD